MAYSKEMKRLNLALSLDDQTKFIGIKSFLKLDKDADVIRACINEMYMNLCMDVSKLETISDAIRVIDLLKSDLYKLLSECRKEC